MKRSLAFPSRCLCAALWIGAAAIGVDRTARAETTPTPPAASAPPASALAQPPAGASAAAPIVEIKGFRSALFGMSEADVRAAIVKDFGVSPDSIHASQNGAEHTRILLVKAPDVLPDGGVAEVAYVLGYKTKKLIQIGVSWSAATDDKLTPERLLSNAETLRAYFLSASYKPDTIVNNMPVSDGLLMFRGGDLEGRTTVLLLRGATSGDKPPRTFSPTGLALFYLADAKNPDVYRLPPGKF
jgi:hypothetical protein